MKNRLCLPLFAEIRVKNGNPPDIVHCGNIEARKLIWLGPQDPKHKSCRQTTIQNTRMGEESNQRDRVSYVSSMFVKYSPKIRGFILSLVPNMELADDVLQETFLTVTKKADDFEPESNFVAWACRIAQFKVLEECRRNRKACGAFSNEVIEAICAAHPGPQQDEPVQRLDALKWCINRLAPHTQRAFELRYQNAHKTSEIAQILGWSVDSVCVILSRGRATLKKCIASRMGLEENGA